MYLDRNQFSETKLTDEVHNVKSRFKEIFEDIDVISEFHTRASKPTENTDYIQDSTELTIEGYTAEMFIRRDFNTVYLHFEIELPEDIIEAEGMVRGYLSTINEYGVTFPEVIHLGDKAHIRVNVPTE